jgi:2-octaprenyl-6-methoxyphenol hydroxylase
MSDQNLGDCDKDGLAVRQAGVVVQGAGPAGATLACRLAAEGIEVALIDRMELGAMAAPAFDGRAYAIAAGSRRLLEAAGIWQCLPWEPGPIEGIRISDGKVGRAASPLFLHFDHREADPEQTEPGPFGWMVEARALRIAINRRIEQLPALLLRAPAEAVLTRTDEQITARLSTGETIHAQLAVGADGRKSRLREQAGIGVVKLPYGQSGIVCAISHDLPHHNVALEHFLPGGPFAQLPMKGTPEAPHLSALVWTERTKFAERLMALPDDIFEREALRRLGHHLGAIKLAGPRWSYPLSLQHAQTYISTRLALIADAAHGMHPIAGQGLNVGFRDIEALADLLIEAHQNDQDLGSPALLAAYERKRRPDNLKMLAATDLLDRLFSTNNPALRLARDIGIAAVHRLPPLKRRFMREAMAK